MSAAALAGLNSGKQASATFPGANGRLVFVSEKDGGREIYSVNPDGSEEKRLTTSPASSDDMPSWSSDGTKIVFVRSGQGYSNIYEMNADGSGVKVLTNSTTNHYTDLDFDPSLSPDGTKVVFDRLNNGARSLYIMNADGSGVKILSTSQPNEHDPRWSPDGTKIVFAAGNEGIFVVKPDGTGIIKVGPFGGQKPDFSPDGSRIAFQYEGGIAIVNSDGSGGLKVVPNTIGERGPRWSPDGTKIVFGKNDGLYIINEDGSELKRIYSEDPSTFVGAPDWAVGTRELTLAINSVDASSGKPIEGVWTTIRSADGTLLKSGFTPLSFAGNMGISYKVMVANYDGKVFEHWNDAATIYGENITSNIRTIQLNASTTLNAVYNVGDSLRGFTPLTFAGPDHQQQQTSLTVNALSLANNQTLHMSMIIDPQQSTNSSGTTTTTYKVYATNGYQNLVFDHWSDNGSTDRIRTLIVAKDTTITAYYREE